MKRKTATKSTKKAETHKVAPKDKKGKTIKVKRGEVNLSLLNSL